MTDTEPAVESEDAVDLAVERPEGYPPECEHLDLDDGLLSHWARLPEMADEIEATQDKLDDLFAERLEAFAALSAAGVRQRIIAAAAKVTPMAVSFALHKQRRRAAEKG